MKHIGMDVHSTTTDACVRNGRGVIVLRRRIRTTQSELIDFVASIQGQKRVVLEEDQMADWVTRLLQPHVDEVIRCQPQYNKLISGSEDKCDKMDARVFIGAALPEPNQTRASPRDEVPDTCGRRCGRIGLRPGI